MPDVSLFCFAATSFTKSGEIDEDAFRQFLQRFIDAEHGSRRDGVTGLRGSAASAGAGRIGPLSIGYVAATK